MSVIPRSAICSNLCAFSSIKHISIFDGRDTFFFKEKGYQTVGLDLSEEAIKMAKSSYSEIEFLQGSIFHTPFQSDSFHIVFGNFILHLFSHNERLEIIKECRRITKLGGVIIFSVSSVEDPDYQKGVEIEKNSFTNTRGVLKHYYSKDDVYEEFQNFSTIEIENIEEHHTHDFPHIHQSYLIYADK